MTRQSSSNVERGAEILIALGNAGPGGLSLTELATTTEDAKSAVHRALTGLARYGFVEQSGRRGNYRLGSTIFALSRRMPGFADLVELLRPALISISARTGSSSFLMARSGLDAVCLDMQMGPALVQPLLSGIGGRLPLGVSHAGICMLARLDRQSRETIIEINRPQYDKWNIEMPTIRAEIEMFLQTGYVIGTRQTAGFDLWVLSLAPRPGDNRYGEIAVSLLASARDINDTVINHHLAMAAEFLPFSTTPALQQKQPLPAAV